MLRETLLQVAAEAVVQAFCHRYFAERTRKTYLSIQKSAGAAPFLSFRAKPRNLWLFLADTMNGIPVRLEMSRLGST
jgi:hypothetical protein